MVSLRSESTTDQQETDGQPEINSKRQGSRQRGKAKCVPDALPSPTSSSKQSQGFRGLSTCHRAQLPVITEASLGVTNMTVEEEFEVLQHEAEAAAEQALHNGKKAMDTPARNTRARNRLLALPVPVVSDAKKHQQQGNGELQSADGDVSAAEQASPQSSGSGSHPGLLVRAPGSHPAHHADSFDESEQTSNLLSIPLAAPELEHRREEAGTEGRPPPLPAGTDSDHEEPASSSSGWSSDEGDADGAIALGQMAQSMLAALRPSQQGSLVTSTAAGGKPHDRWQSTGKYHGGRRPAAVHMSGPAAGQEVTGPLPDSGSKIAEAHWEPAVQLPSLQPADGEGREEVLSRAEPVPAGQLVAPPRDARRIARDARKAAPDTAGSKWYDLPATQVTDEMKRDLRLLRLRGVMDPKRFYKSADQTRFPKYFQFGTVVEGPTEFYSGRMTRKERKQTLTEELLADATLTQSRRKRFDALQQEKQRWGRKRGRPTSRERKKVYKRPRH